MSMIIYLAGPMKGYMDLNYPEFNDVAMLLRKSGFKVINPAETRTEDGEAITEENMTDELYERLVQVGIFHAAVVDAIVLLDGWEQSNGACRELEAAEIAGTKVLSWHLIGPAIVIHQAAKPMNFKLSPGPDPEGLPDIRHIRKNKNPNWYGGTFQPRVRGFNRLGKKPY